MDQQIIIVIDLFNSFKISLKCIDTWLAEKCVVYCWKMSTCDMLYRQYTYIVVKYIVYLSELYQRRVFGLLFCPVSQRVQMEFIFFDNVSILCLSCNVKKSKTTAKLLKQIAETSVASNSF
jgi:hypothetical protein